MNIKEISIDKATVLVIEGRIDSTTSALLEKKLLIMIEEKGVKNMIIDFSSMDYISSAGLRVLLMAAKRTDKMGGEIVLSGLDANVREVFEISGFSIMFTMYASQADAINAF